MYCVLPDPLPVPEEEKGEKVALESALCWHPGVRHIIYLLEDDITHTQPLTEPEIMHSTR
jgi:hypothetical protein